MQNNNIKVLIDNGHGVETPGKRSPDGRLREYAYTRTIADRVMTELQKAGIDAIRIVTEESDIPMSERVTRANKIYKESDKKAIFISIHCDAMGNGSEWMPAHGWSIFVDPTASTKSKELATAIGKVAKNKKITVRQQYPTELYWTAPLYMCKNTHCPAVLIENFFQDNKEDVEFLLSEAGKQLVTDITVEGIQNYLNF